MDKPYFSAKEMSPLFFAIFLDILGFGLIYPVLTAFFISIDSPLLTLVSERVRFWDLGIVLMLYPFFMFFGSSFMGDLSDKMGRKRVILTCMIGLSLGFALMGLGITFSLFSLLCIGRALSGLMAASMPLVLAVISDLSLPTNKAKNMSYVALIQSIGFVLGALLGGILSDSHLFKFLNFSTPFYLSSILAFAAFIWIFTSFEETITTQVKNVRKIDFLRVFKNLSDAAKNPKIRLLSIAFFLMQTAVAIYLQLILIYFRIQFDYTSALLGIFNAYIGLWFGIGILFILPYCIRLLKIEKIATLFMCLAGLFEILLALSRSDLSLWLLTIPLAISIEVGFTAILTSFSNAAKPSHQGWAMGITGTLLALSFGITAFSPNLVPSMGVPALIFIGGLLMLIASMMMIYFCKYHLKTEKKA